MYFYQLEKIKSTIKVAMETQKPRKKIFCDRSDSEAKYN